MKYKRSLSVLMALSCVAMIHLTNPKAYDVTGMQAINSDLMWLTISSFKQLDEQVQECTYNSDCDK